MDAEILQELYTRYYSRAMLYTLSLCGDEEPAKDTGFPNEYNLESHFRSMVTYCRDYQKNVIDIGIVEDPEYFDKVLSYLDENGIRFYGCYASGDAESFLWLSENGYIADYHPIEITRPSKYHYDTPTFGG